MSLWERLGNAAMLDIESTDFSWNDLSSLHHTEHTSSTEHSEDEMNKALEVFCVALVCMRPLCSLISSILPKISIYYAEMFWKKK